MTLARRIGWIALALAAGASMLSPSGRPFSPADAAAKCGTTLAARPGTMRTASFTTSAVAQFTVAPSPLDPASPQASFDGTNASGADCGTITDYAWHFGDEADPAATTSSGTSATTTHAYPAGRGHYSAWLKITDASGTTESSPVDVWASAIPVAQLTVPPSPLKPGAAASFSAAGSTAPGGSIASYVWHWGDGTPDTTTNAPTDTAQHTFAEGSSQSVTLTVVNDLGLASAPATQAIAVHNQLPLVQLTATPSTVNAGQTLTLSAAGSSDPDGTIVRYDWDLDANGSFETATGLTPTVTAGPYPNAGVIHLRVRVTDDSGGTSVASVPVTVVDPTGGAGGGGSGGSSGGGGSGGSSGGGGAPGGSSGGGGGGSTGAAAAPFAVGLSGTAIQRLKTALKRGVGLQARANRAATGKLTLSVTASDARKLGLSRKARKPVAIGTLKLSLRAGRTAKPSIKLTRKAAAVLRRLSPRTLRVTIRGTLAAGSARVSAVRVVLLRR